MRYVRRFPGAASLAGVAGRGVVAHTGSVALRALADRPGLTAAMSAALTRRGFVPVHDRGRGLADTAVMIADGGRVHTSSPELSRRGRPPVTSGRCRRGPPVRHDPGGAARTTCG